MLQPLSPSSTWVQYAQAHAEARQLQVPVHGPAALTWCALIAHAALLHKDWKLDDYLEAYLAL
jgi:hypothetical protein